MCPCDEETTDLVLLYMGFLQKQGRVNGMVKLYLRILGELRAHRPNARVEIYTWDSDPDDRAEFILQTLPKNRKIRIVIVGFSYGGYTAKLLTDRLKDRGIEVELVFLLDAVYRHWYALGQWRSLVPWSTIRICDTVKRVIQYRQRNSLPSGHRIVVDNRLKTELGPINWVNAKHVFVDDQKYIHDECVAEILKVFEIESVSPST